MKKYLLFTLAIFLLTIDVSSQTILQGVIDKDSILPANIDYVLKGKLVVKSGSKLKIEEGTTIRAYPDFDTQLIIESGAKIIAEGTLLKPIVFTSFSSSPEPGDWFGIFIHGKAKNNNGVDLVSNHGFIHGGNNDNDNSGILKYVRIEYAGSEEMDPPADAASLFLYSVGSATKIEFLQVHESYDDAIEIEGGAVNFKNIVVTDTYADESFDFFNGWRGTVENAYFVHTNTRIYGVNTIEGENNRNNHEAVPVSDAKFVNLTIVGPGSSYNESNETFLVRRGAKINFQNLYVKGFSKAFKFRDKVTADIIKLDKSNAKNVTFEDVTISFESDISSNGEPATKEEFFSGLGNGIKTDIWNWGLEWTTGIEGVLSNQTFDIVKTSNIVAYPNPVKNKLFLNKSEISNHILIYDLTGKIYIDKILDDNKIDLKDLPNGFYLCKVNSSLLKIIKE